MKTLCAFIYCDGPKELYREHKTTKTLDAFSPKANSWVCTGSNNPDEGDYQ